MRGTTLSCNEGRLRPGINRKIKGSSRPNSSPGGMIFLARSDGKILLQRRSPNNKIFPNCWDSSSSFHVTFGESYEQAARRELREETAVSALFEYLGKFWCHVPPRTRSWHCSPARAMTRSDSIKRNHLTHHSTQETK